MKARELFEAKAPGVLDTYEKVLEWVEKHNGKKIVLTLADGISRFPPYKISCMRFMHKKSAIFKKPLPVQFLRVNYYEAEECKYLTNFSQLNVEIVESVLDVQRTDITSLENCPIVKTALRVQGCPITSLKGFPKELKTFTGYNILITSIDLEPEDRALQDFMVPSSRLETLEGIHKKFPNLKQIQINSCPIQHNILGLMKLPNLKTIICSQANTGTAAGTALEHVEYAIKNKESILDTQEWLIKNGLKTYARL